CDTFDAPSTHGGRAAEIDRGRFSVNRSEGCDMDKPTPIGPATIQSCRAGLSSPVLPPNDFLVCDPSSTVPSPHLVMAAAEQNYGNATLRIRQPFDFAGRTGKI